MLKQADDNFGVQYLRSYFVTGDEGKQQFPQALRLLLSALSRNVNSHHALNFLWVQIHLHKNILKYFLLHLISWQGGSPRTDRKIQSHSPYASSLTSKYFTSTPGHGHGDPKWTPRGEASKSLQIYHLAPVWTWNGHHQLLKTGWSQHSLSPLHPSPGITFLQQSNTECNHLGQDREKALTYKARNKALHLPLTNITIPDFHSKEDNTVSWTL